MLRVYFTFKNSLSVEKNSYNCDKIGKNRMFEKVCRICEISTIKTQRKLKICALFRINARKLTAIKENSFHTRVQRRELYKDLINYLLITAAQSTCCTVSSARWWQEQKLIISNCFRFFEIKKRKKEERNTTFNYVRKLFLVVSWENTYDTFFPVVSLSSQIRDVVTKSRCEHV